MSKLCLIFNIPSLYRKAIYKSIDEQYDCDWYFGPTTAGIKEMDTSILKRVRRYSVIGNVNKVFWNVGMLKLLFKKEYQNYFMLYENRCLTDYVFFFLAFFFYRKKRFYIWTHGWYGKEQGLDAKIKLWIYKHVNGVFVYGNYARNLLLEQGIPPEKLFTIYNSLNYDEQKALREDMQPSKVYSEYFGNSNPVIIFIGRLTKVKQLDMLIKSIADLKKIGEDYNLVFVGDGLEKDNLQTLVDSLKIKNQVWFYGSCYDEKTNAELVYNSDLCVAPGNVGLTAMHTMMFGCPVISHNCFEWQMPEFEAIIPGETGDFFTYKDNDSLTGTIRHWFHEKGGMRDIVRDACFREIDNNWNPYNQMRIIKKIIVI